MFALFSHQQHSSRVWRWIISQIHCSKIYESRLCCTLLYMFLQPGESLTYSTASHTAAKCYCEPSQISHTPLTCKPRSTESNGSMLRVIAKKSIWIYFISHCVNVNCCFFEAFVFHQSKNFSRLIPWRSPVTITKIGCLLFLAISIGFKCCPVLGKMDLYVLSSSRDHQLHLNRCPKHLATAPHLIRSRPLWTPL